MSTSDTLNIPKQTSSHPRYDAYKDSGVEWLGEIPGHWETSKLKWLLSVKSGESSPDMSMGGGNPVFGANGIIGYSTESNLTSRTILIGRVGSSGAINVAEKGAWATDNALVVNLNQKEIGFGFARYLFEALDLGRLASKNAQPLITASLVTNAYAGLPPREEQRAIAAYLDRETERIGTLVEKKERLIELLEEKRTALISHAVTKGLDDDAEMKDSGVEWLGEIPAGWGTAKLKHVCTQIKDGLHHTPSKVPENDGVPFISTQHVRHREVNIGDATYIAREDYEAGHPSVAPEPGDVLITLVGSIGFAAILPDEMYPISATRHVGYVRPGDKLSAEYLCHYTESTAFKRFLGLETSQVAQPSIYLTSLANHTVPLPPLDEQREIAGRLNDILKRFDTLTTRVRDGIDRLKEYRTALISAAVTGQIDVREEAEMYK